MVGKADEVIKWLLNQDREKLFEIKPYRQKRSLNANAYAWVLINEMANRLRTSKDEVYQEMLKRYGQSKVISVLSEIDISRFVKYYEEIGKGHVEGKEFTHYRCFIGSSEYDSREMAILIDGIVDEAQELGIDTLPTTAVERMKALWQGQNH
ncbi:MAG: hypothetical protein IKE94_05485 [Aeriscardovia sp.]|jgi:hypothetical protein|nr:hypothetical protein [Aeriscardovia sp.]MBR6843444.1 hypothetical protein [Prevotella sp.]